MMALPTEGAGKDDEGSHQCAFVFQQLELIIVRLALEVGLVDPRLSPLHA